LPQEQRGCIIAAVTGAPEGDPPGGTAQTGGPLATRPAPKRNLREGDAL
jgi:hypothetical protein